MPGFSKLLQLPLQKMSEIVSDSEEPTNIHRVHTQESLLAFQLRHTWALAFDLVSHSYQIDSFPTSDLFQY